MTTDLLEVSLFGIRTPLELRRVVEPVKLIDLDRTTVDTAEGSEVSAFPGASGRVAVRFGSLLAGEAKSLRLP